MYLLGEQPAYADQLISRLQSIPAKLLDGLSPCGEPLQIERSENLAADLPSNQLFIIDNGLLHALVDERPLFYLQEGDLVGLRQGIDLPTCRYTSDEPLTLIPYSRSDVFKHIYADEPRQELFIQYWSAIPPCCPMPWRASSSPRFVHPPASSTSPRAMH